MPTRKVTCPKCKGTGESDEYYFEPHYALIGDHPQHAWLSGYHGMGYYVYVARDRVVQYNTEEEAQAAAESRVKRWRKVRQQPSEGS